MNSDGSKGLCNNVLLLEEFPVVCVWGGVRVGRCRSVGLAQGSDPFILVLIALRRFVCHFYPFHLLTERKYV